MIRTLATKVLSTMLCLLLVILTGPLGSEVQVSAQEPAPAYTGQGVPLTAQELQGLAAPIALYPDALVAQILGGATFPDQIVLAANWLQQHPGLTGQPLLEAVNAQSWEPSVKALTQFPTVLGDMAKNLSWTSSLGEAYATQGADLMAAVQVLRAKAQAAGNLKSGSQITVVQQSPQVIVIQPVNPQVIYVPAYNPAVVYGYPYVVPGYSTAAVVTTGVIAFGVGIAVGMAISGGYGWGWNSWNCGWHGSTVVYHGGAYYGNAAWHGGGYGSVSTAYNPYNGAVARGGTVSNGYGTASGAKGYNPRTGASAGTVQGSNAYGSYGASTASKNGTTVNSQHQTNANGTTAQAHSSNGGSAYAASGKYGNSAAVGQTANGNKYASANGNTYSNTGSGWSGNSNNTQQHNASQPSAASKGYGSQPKPSGSSAFGGGGGGGWQSRANSSRGAASMGGGGGWSRGGGGGGGFHR